MSEKLQSQDIKDHTEKEYRLTPNNGTFTIAEQIGGLYTKHLTRDIVLSELDKDGCIVKVRQVVSMYMVRFKLKQEAFDRVVYVLAENEDDAFSQATCEKLPFGDRGVDRVVEEKEGWPEGTATIPTYLEKKYIERIPFRIRGWSTAEF